MIKKLYKGYLIESKGFKSPPARENNYIKEIEFKISKKEKNASFIFKVDGLNLDAMATVMNDPEKYLLSLCIDKIKESLNKQNKLINLVFKYTGSHFEE